MTTLGRFFLTDLFFILIVGFAMICVTELSQLWNKAKRKSIIEVLQGALSGLGVFGVILILLAIWGVR